MVVHFICIVVLPLENTQTALVSIFIRIQHFLLVNNTYIFVFEHSFMIVYQIFWFYFIMALFFFYFYLFFAFSQYLFLQLPHNAGWFEKCYNLREVPITLKQMCKVVQERISTFSIWRENLLKSHRKRYLYTFQANWCVSCVLRKLVRIQNYDLVRAILCSYTIPPFIDMDFGIILSHLPFYVAI